MPAPKEQPPRKLSGKRTVTTVNLESGYCEAEVRFVVIRRRDNVLRQTDRWGPDGWFL